MSTSTSIVDTHYDTSVEATSSSSGGEESRIWCPDVDSDGYGDPSDPTRCIWAIGPVDGHADNATDCDDADDHTFPGAAEREPQDETTCLRDMDEDGWGDARPANMDVVAGGDCYDENSTLNPDRVWLSAFVPYGEPKAPRALVFFDEDADLLGPPVMAEPESATPYDITSATIGPDSTILINDQAVLRFLRVDYDHRSACEMPPETWIPTSLGSYSQGEPRFVCGIEWGPGGLLYGFDAEQDVLVTFDPRTGLILPGSEVPLWGAEGPLTLDDCGLAYDCHDDRLLLASSDQVIYAVDPETGLAELLREFNFLIQTTSIGLAYDPSTRNVNLSTGYNRYRFLLDDDAVPTAESLPDVGLVSNLQYLPRCVEAFR